MKFLFTANSSKGVCMKFRALVVFIILCVVGEAEAYEGPSPLRDIKIDVNLTSSATGSLTYQYSISNPSTNDGSIYSIDIFLSQDPQLDSNRPSVDFKQCSHFGRQSSSDCPKLHA